jgi:seryl-tRNA synthetase
MADLTLPLANIEPEYLSHLEYALAFVTEDVSEWRIDTAAGVLHASLVEGADPALIQQKLQQLVDRYQNSEFGHKSETYFEQTANVGQRDAWGELLARKWATEVGDGHVILRGDAALLMAFIDQEVMREFARPFGAELECYPATILCRTLDRCNHFSSFPEHVDFVSHLRPDVDVLQQFVKSCEAGGWSADCHAGRMAENDYAISPSCCYHCYEGMEGWELSGPGRCITAILGCHRFEGANQKTLSRLRSFTMREVIWVGHPRYVLESRAKAEELIIEQARRWGLQCRLEIANDMFFTNDFAVKASFQRQQEAKKELRALIPQEDKMISVISSNFHSATFGKAFDIRVGGRPAVSACVGWGLERIVYAVVSQFGLDSAGWPVGLREDFLAYKASCGGGR